MITGLTSSRVNLSVFASAPREKATGPAWPDVECPVLSCTRRTHLCTKWNIPLEPPSGAPPTHIQMIINRHGRLPTVSNRLFLTYPDIILSNFARQVRCFGRHLLMPVRRPPATRSSGKTDLIFNNILIVSTGVICWCYWFENWPWTKRSSLLAWSENKLFVWC